MDHVQRSMLRSAGQQFATIGLIFLLPVLALALLGLLTDSLAIGTWQRGVLLVCWTLGLLYAYAWRPRHR
jgi:hypothetical protein